MTALPDTLRVIERGWLSSNSIMLFDGEGATLVDSGYVGHADATVRLVSEALKSVPGTAVRQGLTRLVNTHSHSDHIGGNAALRSAFGCSILIPAGIEHMIRAWDEDALLLTVARQRAAPFAFDGVVQAGDELAMGGLLWQALAAPGHDMAALVFYNAERRILISGDALWEDGFGIVFGALFERAAGGVDALEASRQTLDMLARLPIDVVIPGHGAPFGEVDRALKRAYARLEANMRDRHRLARSAVKALLTFNLLETGRLREADLPDYLDGMPFFTLLKAKNFGHAATATLAESLLAELHLAGAVSLRNGWIEPTMPG